MSLDALVNRVRQAEQAVEVREQRTRLQWEQFKATWRAGWTPGRILVVGLAAGFVAGRAKPLRLAGNGGVFDLLRALAPLFAGVQAVRTAVDEMQAAPSADAPPETQASP